MHERVILFLFKKKKKKTNGPPALQLDITDALDQELMVAAEGDIHALLAYL